MSKIENVLYYAKYNKKMFVYKAIQKTIKTKILRMLIPPMLHIKIDYYIRLGKHINLSSPATFNEKLQWLKLHDRKPEYRNMVDKYEVRKYIAETIGEIYLIPLLGVYDFFDDIDFNTLPEQFVLKCTHDSGGIIICKDKSKFDIDAARIKINNYLKRNYYYHGMEWPYKNVKPRIICEKYMADDTGIDLKDYKFMCFNCEVKCCNVCLNRNSLTGLNIDFYDMDWNLMPFERQDHPSSGTIIPKPENFEEMIIFAEMLSKDKSFVRVDFYEICGKLYFGELTFYPGSGFMKFIPESYDNLLGSWLDLSQNK